MNKQISAVEASKLQNDESVVLLDVREASERSICKIETALHIPLGEIPARCHTLPKDKTIIVFCHHGMRSQRAQEFLLARGFDTVINLVGGIHAWVTEVNPQMQTY